MRRNHDLGSRSHFWPPTTLFQPNASVFRRREFAGQHVVDERKKLLIKARDVEETDRVVDLRELVHRLDFHHLFHGPDAAGHRDEGGPYVRSVALPIRWKTLADRRQQATDFGEQFGDRLLVVCEMLEQRALKQAVEQRIE